jgi:DNA-binding Lrp family transcriptional regulator
MLKLTDLDKKILFELDKDGRANFSKIARALGTSPQVVKYHFERLMENGAITNFWAFIDYDRAGYSFFWGYWLKFSGLTKKQEEEMYAKFKANKYIPIVMRCDGYADVMLGVIAMDIFQHNKIVQELFSEFGKYITMSDMVVGLGFQRFPRTYLIGKNNDEKIFHLSGGKPEAAKLTEVDRKIMSLLQMDGRMEFTKIAKILDVSVSLVHASFKKLQKEKIINATTFTLNHNLLGLRLYRVLFKILQFDQKRIDELHDFCLINKNINNYVSVMGNWQLMADVEIESHEGLRELLREMKYQFRDVIFQIEINEVYSVEKFSQMVIEYPELMSEQNIEMKGNEKESLSEEEVKKDEYWS